MTQRSPCRYCIPKAISLTQSAHSPEQPGALNGSQHHIHFGIANVLAITWLLPSVQPGRCLWSVLATQSSDQESRSPLRQQKDILLRVTTGFSFVNHTTTPPALFINAKVSSSPHSIIPANIRRELATTTSKTERRGASWPALKRQASCRDQFQSPARRPSTSTEPPP